MMQRRDWYVCLHACVGFACVVCVRGCGLCVLDVLMVGLHVKLGVGGMWLLLLRIRFCIYLFLDGCEYG